MGSNTSQVDFFFERYRMGEVGGYDVLKYGEREVRKKSKATQSFSKWGNALYAPKQKLIQEKNAILSISHRSQDAGLKVHQFARRNVVLHDIARRCVHGSSRIPAARSFSARVRHGGGSSFVAYSDVLSITEESSGLPFFPSQDFRFFFTTT